MLRIEEARRVLQTLNEAGPGGMSLMLLSDRSGIALDSLRDYLQKHSEFFVLLDGGPRYTLNRFGEFKGSIEKMIDHLQVLQEKAWQEKWRLRTLGIFLLGMYAGTMMESILTVISKWWTGTLP
jgi:hypothetical protein